MNTPLLYTERLILRRFTGEDLDALYRIYSDEEVNRFLPPGFPSKRGGKRSFSLRNSMRNRMRCRLAIAMRFA